MPTLLDDCKKMIQAATKWDHIQGTLKYAFGNNVFVKEGVKHLEELAEGARSSNNIYDINNFISEFKKSNWIIQTRFLDDDNNKDMIETIKKYISPDAIGKQIFEENFKLGEDIFKKIDFDYKIDAMTKDKSLKEKLWQKNKEAMNKYQEYYNRETDKIYANMPDEIYYDLDKRNEAVALELKKHKEYNTLLSEMKDADKKYKEIADKVIYGHKKILNEIKDELLKHSKISQEEASEWVEKNVSIDDSFIKRMQGRSAAELQGGSLSNPEEIPALSEIKNELATIYRIANGKLDILQIKGKSALDKDNRSYANGRAIHWLDTDLGTLWHEAGHIFEHTNPVFLAAAKDFIKSRSTGRPEQLSTLTGNYLFDDNEIAYPDHFSNPYVGKIYPGATEVFSMGLQILGSLPYLSSGVNDLQHLKFCFGCFLSEIKNTQENSINTQQNAVDGDVTFSFSGLKKSEWKKALSGVVTDEFVEKLTSTKGFEGFKIVEGKTKLKQYGACLLKYNKKIVGAGPLFKFIKKELATEAYLALLNMKELIPEARLDVVKKARRGYETPWYLNVNPNSVPDWFTPLTELPRLL